MSTLLRFGIVGCGAVASRHIAQIRQHGKLVACCDTDIARAEAVATEHGANAYLSIEELLENERELDVITICTPNGLHAAHTIRSLRAGLHVLCEKPMALKSSDCKMMIDAAAKAAKYLFIVKQNRFNPPVIAVKKMLDEQMLGEIYSVQINGFWNRTEEYYQQSWRSTVAMSGGTLFAQFSHFIDLMYWLVGDVAEVQSFLANRAHPGIEFEDSGVANMKFANGAIGNIHFTVNSYATNMEGSVTIFAEKGTVKIGGQYLNELSYQRMHAGEITGVTAGNPPNQYGSYQGSMSNHDKVYENLVDVILGDAVIATNGFEGLKTVEIIEKIYRAGRNA